MYCAECGNKKEQRLDGAWKICCNGYGYWYDGNPLDKDRWWPLTKSGKFYLYLNYSCPSDFKEKKPKE